ncbi:hypothetical protein [Methylobacterium sp. J-076]|uniref:hypothetical protein n=1 Tax=Methylobacterium sp. J-076 TaxID=2836655 RepID=UPI0028C50AA9|nr:hypothetical protein [Methylobacterium sp. J-076]
MGEYLVMFHKVVPDALGDDRSVLQRRAVVAARSDVAAAYAAKAMFSEAAGIADWRMRADTCVVIALPAAWREIGIGAEGGEPARSAPRGAERAPAPPPALAAHA